MKANTDGSESPYELNITYFDALGDNPDTVTDRHIARFLCSQVVAMELQGVPAVYFHSLTATRNYHEGVEATGRARTINRRKWREEELEALLFDRRSATAQVMKQYTRWLQLRSLHKVFHPSASQRIVDLGPELFVVVREAEGRQVVCISNFTDGYMELKLDDRLKEISDADVVSDILTGRRYMGEGKVIAFDAYQTVWLQV